MRTKRNPTGIRVRHARACPATDGGSCRCKPSFEAWTFSARDGKKIRRTFPTVAAAKSWRADATVAISRGTLTAARRLTVDQAADEWLVAARAGEALTRSGAPYKPSVLREFDRSLEHYVRPALGGLRLDQLRRRDVQALVDRLVASGLSGSTVRNAVMPLRVLCRRAIEADDLAVNPTAHLRMPEGARRRERAASAGEAAALLAALPDGDRALWATAFYAGLRRGELRALRVEDVDAACTKLHVRRGWDAVEGEIAPKSEKGARVVPVSGALRLHLLEHLALTGRRGSDLVFGRTRALPFTPGAVTARAAKAWAAAAVAAFLSGRPTSVAIEPIGLHECRHSYVSLMHAAGLSLERIGDYVGHSSTYMTDRYRHLLDGHETEAAEMLDAYLSRSTGASTTGRVAPVLRDAN